MKKASYLFQFILLLMLTATSCTSSGTSAKKTRQESGEQKIEVQAPEKDEIAEAQKQLEGEWINDRFFAKVIQTKEVYSNRAELKGLYGFSLKSKGKEICLKGVYIHEGALDECFRFDLTPKGPRFVAGSRELLLKGKSLYFTEKGVRRAYRKVDSYRNALSARLVGGVYHAVDENNSSSTVVLRPDGMHCTFRGYRRYEVITDFTEGIEFDAIVFYKSEKGRNWADGDIFAFEWRGDQLVLRKVDANWDTYDHSISDKEIVMRRS